MRKTNTAPYVFRKRSVYYFSRRVPEDLKGYYRRDRITVSLRTKSLQAAQLRAKTLAAKLDEDWLAMRWRTTNDPFSKFLNDRVVSFVEPAGAPLLSQAEKLYVQIKGAGRSKTFKQAATRSIGYMIKLFGDRPINMYSWTDINFF